MESKSPITNLNLRRAWNDSIRERTHIPILIIGAGIGALYCASQLGKSNKIGIFESSPQVGGRIRTIDQQVDRGAWRVHSTHKRMQKLAKQLHIPLKPTHSSQVVAQTKSKDTPKTYDSTLTNAQIKTPSIPGLSPFQSNVIQHSFQQAQLAEQYTGYLGLQDGLGRTYQVHTKGVFQVPTKGMDQFPLKLTKSLPSNVKIHFKSRVIQMDRENGVYWLTVQDREGNKTYWSCDTLILGCQPAHIPPSNFSSYLQPVCDCVETRPLTHVYVDVNEPLDPTYHITANALGQLISISPKVLMASYTGGQLASLHFQRHLKDPKAYTEWLQKLIRTSLNKPNLVVSNVRVFYYEKAVGIWLPNVMGRQCMNECAIPHPIRLPNLYWINENLSKSFQGWAEGSLEVADFVLQTIQSNKSKPFRYFNAIPKHCISIDGRILDVKEWMTMHPGGAMVIKKYLGKDVSDLFRNVHSTKSGAFNLILPLQIGFLKS